MSFSLRKSSIDLGLYEILEEGEVVKEVAVAFKLYKWPPEFASIEEIERWILNEEKQRAKRAAYRLLEAKRQSTFELYQKLGRKGFSRPVIDSTIEEFKELGYVSDADLIPSIIEREIRRGYGPRYIEMKLRSLGLETALVRKIVTEKVQREAIAKLKGRSAAALQRRGFDMGVIFSCLGN
jgi:SOS response regulatory protein OraA/RecX